MGILRIRLEDLVLRIGSGKLWSARKVRQPFRNFFKYYFCINGLISMIKSKTVLNNFGKIILF